MIISQSGESFVMLREKGVTDAAAFSNTHSAARNSASVDADDSAFHMSSDERDLLEVLKVELEFVQQGGYGNLPRARWRPQFMFEDSPTCPNSHIREERVPCTECVLIELVPLKWRTEKIPCRHIPLKETGETLDYYYRCGTPEELEEAFIEWLRKTIHHLEQNRAATEKDNHDRKV